MFSFEEAAKQWKNEMEYMQSFPYPYSNKCGRCATGKIVGVVCDSCGFSYEQKQCPRCNTWMHHGYLDNDLDHCTLYCEPELKRQKEREEYAILRETLLPEVDKLDSGRYCISFEGELYLNKMQLEALKEILNNRKDLL